MRTGLPLCRLISHRARGAQCPPLIELRAISRPSRRHRARQVPHTWPSVSGRKSRNRKRARADNRLTLWGPVSSCCRRRRPLLARRPVSAPVCVDGNYGRCEGANICRSKFARLAAWNQDLAFSKLAYFGPSLWPTISSLGFRLSAVAAEVNRGKLGINHSVVSLASPAANHGRQLSSSERPINPLNRWTRKAFRARELLSGVCVRAPSSAPPMATFTCASLRGQLCNQ